MFSCLIMSNSLWPHGLQHTRSLSPSPSFKICPGSCWLHRWCHPAVSSSDNPLLLPSIFLSIRAFSSESAVHIKWPKYWSLNFSISPSNEYSGLISLKIDWFDLVSVQETLRSLFPTPVVWRHQFFSAPLSLHSSSHSRMWPLGDHSLGCMDLCWQSNASAFQHTVYACRPVIAFLPRSKRLPTAWLQLASTVILEPKKSGSVTSSRV